MKWRLKSEKWHIFTDSFSDYQSHAACCCRLFETHKGRCTISQTRPELDTNVLDVLTASEDHSITSGSALVKNAAAERPRTPRLLSCLLSLAQTAADFYVSSSVIASIYLSLSPPTTSTYPARSNCLQFKFYRENIVCISNSQQINRCPDCTVVFLGTEKWMRLYLGPRLSVFQVRAGLLLSESIVQTLVSPSRLALTDCLRNS